MLKCPECGNLVDERLDSCSECGFPLIEFKGVYKR